MSVDVVEGSVNCVDVNVLDTRAGFPSLYPNAYFQRRTKMNADDPAQLPFPVGISTF